MSRLRISLPKLARDRRASTAAEFTLVLPLLLLLLFGIIDGGRFLWETNLAEKATQEGVRMAVVTNVLAPGLIAEDYTGKTFNGTTIKTGDLIPAAALGVIECSSSKGCICKTPPCPATLGMMDSVTFAKVVARMAIIDPNVTSDNVVVAYSGSGLGAAGEGGATSMDVSPFITVRLQQLQFAPITTELFKAKFDMSSFSSTLTAEDASGLYSE